MNIIFVFQKAVNISHYTILLEAHFYDEKRFPAKRNVFKPSTDLPRQQQEALFKPHFTTVLFNISELIDVRLDTKQTHPTVILLTFLKSYTRHYIG